MLTATVLALTAAVLHATWNLLVKQSADRFIALWAQFAVGSLIGLAVVPMFGGYGAVAWQWALVSGLTHLPYTLLLAHCYRIGDFSLTYPIARGGGAVMAAVGGVLILGDHLPFGASLGIAIVGLGLIMLARPNHQREAVAWAFLLAIIIATYTIIDSKGSRASTGSVYGAAIFVPTGFVVSVYGMATGRGRDFVAAWRVSRVASAKLFFAGCASVLTYMLVLIAVRHAPVGYVTGLRESSVVLAALIGWKMLGEGGALRRLWPALVVLSGLIVLIAFR